MANRRRLYKGVQAPRGSNHPPTPDHPLRSYMSELLNSYVCRVRRRTSWWKELEEPVRAREDPYGSRSLALRTVQRRSGLKHTRGGGGC